jgi:hypothetical protein
VGLEGISWRNEFFGGGRLALVVHVGCVILRLRGLRYGLHAPLC